MTDQNKGHGVQVGNMADLTTCFDCQVGVLVEKGFHTVAGKSETEFRQHLGGLKASVLSRIDAVGPKNLSLAIVIPESWVTIPRQVALWNGNGRMPKMDVSKVQNADGVEELRDPYAIIDIEPGVSTKGKSAIAVLQPTKGEYRLWLTLTEGVSLYGYYRDIIQDHAIGLPGSSCGPGIIPVLFLDRNHLRLGHCQLGQARPDCGPVSCGGRIVPR